MIEMLNMHACEYVHVMIVVSDCERNTEELRQTQY